MRSRTGIWEDLPDYRILSESGFIGLRNDFGDQKRKSQKSEKSPQIPVQKKSRKHYASGSFYFS